MRIGRVVQIRVNPADCQSILDLIDIAGENPYDGRSFASCVSTALSSLIGVAMKSGLIQEPDGFKYAEAMQPFGETGNNKRKRNKADDMYGKMQRHVPLSDLSDTVRMGGYRGGIKSEGIDSLSADLTDEDKDRLFQEYSALNEKMNSPDVLPEDKMRYRELGKMLGYE